VYPQRAPQTMGESGPRHNRGFDTGASTKDHKRLCTRRQARTKEARWQSRSWGDIGTLGNRAPA
jgi:hypothetical protein